MYGEEAAKVFFNSINKGQNILDIGSGGEGNPIQQMAESQGIRYKDVDLKNGQNWEKIPIVSMAGKFDGVWMCHTLEHLLNVDSSLRRIRVVLKEGGILAITVPPAKHNIVGGHVSLWNAGLLLYRLIIAGFDCREAIVKNYGYNVSVLTRYRPIRSAHDLLCDAGDIETLAPYFPLPVSQGFNGRDITGPWRDRI